MSKCVCSLVCQKQVAIGITILSSAFGIPNIFANVHIVVGMILADSMQTCTASKGIALTHDKGKR